MQFHLPWALIGFINIMKENIIVLKLRMSISIITNIFIQVVQFQNTERWFTFSLTTTNRSQLNIIAHLFAQLMSKIHLPMNVLHSNSKNLENDMVKAFTLYAKIDVLSDLVSAYYLLTHEMGKEAVTRNGKKHQIRMIYIYEMNGFNLFQ